MQPNKNIVNADEGLVSAGVCGCTSWGLGGGLLSYSCTHSGCLNGAFSYVHILKLVLQTSKYAYCF